MINVAGLIWDPGGGKVGLETEGGRKGLRTDEGWVVCMSKKVKKTGLKKKLKEIVEKIEPRHTQAYKTALRATHILKETAKIPTILCKITNSINPK